MRKGGGAETLATQRWRATQRAAAPRADAAEDASLMARVARCDPAAHRALFERYYRRVFAFVARRLQDRSLCEEVVSDVFFEIWRGAAGFRGDAEVSTWIFGIAHFKALAAYRRSAHPKRATVSLAEHPGFARLAEPRSLAESVESRDEVRRLLRAMESLPEGQREVLRLAFMEGCSYREIAHSLGISEGNVKTRVNRARARLRHVARRAPQVGPGDAP